MNRPTQVIIIGGGAAGFFSAINIAESNPAMGVTILEKGNKVLQKVKVSGGGRCNVTHACFDPRELIEYYPRGKKELLGPFHKFMTGDIMEWFENRGIPLKIEDDNRVFPQSDKSQSIIDCFVTSAQKAGVSVKLGQNVQEIHINKGRFEIKTGTDSFGADKLLICSGGNPKIWQLLKSLGHQIIDPVPSLFTFNIKDAVLSDIPGVSVPNAAVQNKGFKYQCNGPVLITHWGLSGPAILKLSAFGALFLAKKNYEFEVVINWLGLPFSTVLETLLEQKKNTPKKQVYLKPVFQDIPKRLWVKLLKPANIREGQNWSDISHQHIENIAKSITHTALLSHGKTTFKEEFVTAGGVDLKEVDFKRFESKLHPNLFFAGEILNIDGVTGGFNFQNAWTGGYIAAMAVAGS